MAPSTAQREVRDLADPLSLLARSCIASAASQRIRATAAPTQLPRIPLSIFERICDRATYNRAVPPRFASWTILIDNAPTAFRAREAEELLPTLNQLKRKNKEVALKWFARGRLWESQQQERDDFQRRKHGQQGAGAGPAKNANGGIGTGVPAETTRTPARGSTRKSSAAKDASSGHCSSGSRSLAVSIKGSRRLDPRSRDSRKSLSRRIDPRRHAVRISVSNRIDRQNHRSGISARARIKRDDRDLRIVDRPTELADPDDHRIGKPSGRPPANRPPGRPPSNRGGARHRPPNRPFKDDRNRDQRPERPRSESIRNKPPGKPWGDRPRRDDRRDQPERKEQEPPPQRPERPSDTPEPPPNAEQIVIKPEPPERG